MRSFALFAVLLPLLPACGGGSAGEQEPELPVGEACDPGPQTFWLTEGEDFRATLRCATGAVLAGEEFVFTDLPPGSSFDPVTLELRWTPGLDQAAVYRASLTVNPNTQNPELRSFTFGVADAWDHPDNEPIVDPLRYTHEFGTPVFYLEGAPEDKDFAPATLYYRGSRFEIDAKQRGASSLSYPKKNYLLRFGEGIDFNEPDHDMRDRQRVTLISTFDDNSYLRQRLAYALWSETQPRIAMRAFSAVVFLDGEYHGLYTAADFPNDNHMENMGLSRDGDVFKAIDHDANFRDTDREGDPKVTLWQGYEKTEGTPSEGEAGAFDPLESLVDFTINATDEAFNTEIGTRVDVRDYGNWWTLVSLITGSDSAGKNSYHYKDPAGGLFHVVPWDFNHSFGQDWQTRRIGAANVSNYYNRNDLFERLLASQTHGPAIRSEYQSYLAGALSTQAVLTLIETWAQEIDASARRDWAKWENDYRNFSRWSDRSDFTTYDEELNYLRTWVLGHWQAVDDFLSGL